MIDIYSLRARLYPMVIFIMPAIVLCLIYGWESKSTVQILFSLGAFGAFGYLLSHLARDNGKKKEQSLWESWGGPPTSQLLSFSSTKIDSVTKKRYHTKLQRLCPVSPIPSVQLETNNRSATLECYSAWTKYLITQTRSTKTFPLLFKDNISYGFRRNLWGLKPIAITFLIILLFGSYAIWYLKTGTFDPTYFPLSAMLSIVFLILILFFWIFIVTKEWVKVVAFSYAERLLETVDILT